MAGGSRFRLLRTRSPAAGRIRSSKDQLCPELELSRAGAVPAGKRLPTPSVTHACNQSEIRTRYVARRLSPLRRVRNTGRIGAKLKLPSLGYVERSI